MPENMPTASNAPHEGTGHEGAGREEACGCPQWLTGQKGSGKEALPEFSLISGDNPCQPVYLGWGVIGLLLVLALIGRFTMKRVPGKLQGLFEFTMEWVADITHQAMGPAGMAYFPMFISFFLFVLVGNLMGLIPGLASPTSAVNTTAALAVIKVKGKKLYEYARAGQEVPVKPRRVSIRQFSLISYEPPVATFEAKVGSGTYVRSMAHDLGATLGCGACLTRLRRTRVGGFDVRDAYPLDALEAEPEMLGARLLTIGEALSHLPKLAPFCERVEWAAMRAGSAAARSGATHRINRSWPG